MEVKPPTVKGPFYYEAEVMGISTVGDKTVYDIEYIQSEKVHLFESARTYIKLCSGHGPPVGFHAPPPPSLPPSTPTYIRKKTMFRALAYEFRNLTW